MDQKPTNLTNNRQIETNQWPMTNFTWDFQPTPSWPNWPITFNRPDFKHHRLTNTIHLTLKMTSAQVVETSVTNNSSFQNYPHPDNQTIWTTVFTRVLVDPVYKSTPNFWGQKRDFLNLQVRISWKTLLVFLRIFFQLPRICEQITASSNVKFS